MRARDYSGLTAAASGAWLTMAAVVVLHRADVPFPARLVSWVGVVALVLTLSAATRAAASTWRGPEIRNFSSEDATRCGPRDAEVVRVAAQLRGTLGGAGYVHPARLVLSALGWLAAAGSAAAAFLETAPALFPLWGSVALVLCALAMVFPAHAFYYRETSGGGIVVHPRDACDAIIQSRARPAAGESPVPATHSNAPAGWVSSRNDATGGGKPPERRVDVPS